MAYHYESCGLDGIWLGNGYRLTETVHGEAIAIDDIDGLHRAIARWLVRRLRPLTGAEFKFLRKELDLSQKELGALVGAAEQRIFRWERNRRSPVTGPADRLLRMIFLERDDSSKPAAWILDELASLDEVPAEPVTL